MTDKLFVRTATLADLPFALFDGRLSEHIIRRKIELGEIIVAELDDKLIGLVYLEYLWSIIPYMALINVAVDQRGSGIGKAILSSLETLLYNKGHRYLYSSSQADEPEPQHWHRSAGFEECGFIAGINGDGIGEVFFRKVVQGVS